MLPNSSNEIILQLRWCYAYISAALLRSAQSRIPLSNPLKKCKAGHLQNDVGSFTLIDNFSGSFSVIFQCGYFIGAIIALAANFQSGHPSAVSTGTYLAFLVIMFIGTYIHTTYPSPQPDITSDPPLFKLEKARIATVETKIFLYRFKDKRMLAFGQCALLATTNRSYFDGPTRKMFSLIFIQYHVG